MSSFFGDMDKGQKWILGVGAGLMGVVIGYYFLFLRPAPEVTSEVQQPLDEFELENEKSKREEKDKFEQDLLTTIQNRQQYEQDKVEERRRYGVDNFEDEFYIAEEKEKKQDSVVMPVEDAKPEVPKEKVIIRYVPSKEPAAEKEEVKVEEKAAPKKRQGRTRSNFARGNSRQVDNVDKASNATAFALNVSAVIHNGGEVTSQDVLEIRTTESFEYGGKLIPRNTFITGVVRITGSRVLVDVGTVMVNGQLMDFPVTVYDLDGIRGIKIHGGVDKRIKREAVDEAVSEATRTIPLVGPLARSSSRQKLNDTSVPVPAGYAVYLRNN